MTSRKPTPPSPKSDKALQTLLSNSIAVATGDSEEAQKLKEEIAKERTADETLQDVRLASEAADTLLGALTALLSVAEMVEKAESKSKSKFDYYLMVSGAKPCDITEVWYLLIEYLGMPPALAKNLAVRIANNFEGARSWPIAKFHDEGSAMNKLAELQSKLVISDNITFSLTSVEKTKRILKGN